jgi:diacylglycerol kinase family enzyme
VAAASTSQPGDDVPGTSDAESTADILERRARWVIGFNLPCYAGMLRFLTREDADEATHGQGGQLDVCRFDRGGFWHTLYYYVWLLLGRAERIGTRRVDHLAAFRLEAMNPEESIPLQIDGDPAGHLPVDVDVLPGRLTLLTPVSAQHPSVASVGSNENS